MFTRNRGLNSAGNWLNEGLDRERDFESHRKIQSSFNKIPALNWRVRTDTTFEDWTGEKNVSSPLADLHIRFG